MLFPNSMFHLDQEGNCSNLLDNLARNSFRFVSVVPCKNLVSFVKIPFDCMLVSVSSDQPLLAVLFDLANGEDGLVLMLF